MINEPEDFEIEWRRLFSEMLGTFLLVLVAAGGPVVNAFTHGGVSRSAQVVAPGLMVMAVIYFMGAIGGAHLNPVVTISFALRQNFPWRRVPGYVAMQFVGATLAVVPSVDVRQRRVHWVPRCRGTGSAMGR